MKNVLIVNHRIKNCGVQQSGKRIYELVQNSEKVNFYYKEVESKKELINTIEIIKPDSILYNWHQGTMSWLTEQLVREINSKSYFYFHTQPLGNTIGTYLFFGDYALNKNILPESRMILMPRPLLNYKGNYRHNDIINIGSFGFAFWQKGFHTIVKLVNNDFDRAVINLHIPQSHFGDPLGKQLKEVTNECIRLNTNPKIKLNITHNFLNDDGVLEFLANNDINVFNYSDNGEGLSGVPDYALSVKRPIAISDCTMFRHFAKNEIRLDKHSIMDIYKLGTTPLEEYYEKWSIKNFVKKMEEVFNEE